MSTGSDFYYTGGGFSDWSGGSAGNFGSSSGGSSSSGSSSGGNNGYEPGDWKYGCGCLVVIIAVIAALFWYFVRGW